MRILTAAAALTAILGAGPASAMSVYTVDFEEFNDSGASGTATVRHFENQGRLHVRVKADGIEANQTHPMHIHGTFGMDDNPTDAVVPPPEADTDGDGFIEVAEGLPFYGPVIVPLVDEDGMFSTADNGKIRYKRFFDLSDPDTFGGTFELSDLLPIDWRVIVIHGLTVDGEAGDGTPGEVDGTAGYKTPLPVAVGELEKKMRGGGKDDDDGGDDDAGGGGGVVIPLPLPALTLLTALGGLALVGRRRTRS